MRRQLVPAWLSGCVLVAAPAFAQVGGDTERLAKELGADPIAVLRSMGTAATADAAKDIARTWSERLDGHGDRHLRLLRLGLGHADERVVLGAMFLVDRPFLVPELRAATARVVPRIGEPDCPVPADHVLDVIGSTDVPATAAAVQRLPAEEATQWLGQLHRQVRGEHVPALCELALATTGAVRRAAFANAVMAVEYSQQHAPLLLTTWLTCVGAPTNDDDGTGLPEVLVATLRAHLASQARLLQHPQPEAQPQPPDAGSDDRPPAPPVIPCMRWLLASRASDADAPLLRDVATKGCTELRHAALQLLAALGRDEDRTFLRELPDDGYPELPLRLARARAGDAAELERLLAGGADDLAAGLAAAPAARRTAFASWLVTAPASAVLPRLRELEEVANADPMWFAVPAWDDAWLADLEPLATKAAPRLDARVLRALIAVVPSCATAHLANALLARPAAELFALAPENDDDRWLAHAHGDLGFRGVWPFLEVTRPDAFVARLREGVRGDDAAVRATCAGLLARLGDADALPEVAAWLDAEGDTELWRDLARSRSPAVLEALRTRFAAAERPGTALACAMAVALGMPHAVARWWRLPTDATDVLRKLADGDAVGAWVAAAVTEAGVSDELHWADAALVTWREPRIAAWLRVERTRPRPGPGALASFDLALGVYAGEAEARRTLAELWRDGRYALHHEAPELSAHGLGVAWLPFFVDELGSNCCRVAAVEEVLEELFRCDANAYGASDHSEESAAARLRRRLLPLQDRLRWSRIANAYVVAGE